MMGRPKKYAEARTTTTITAPPSVLEQLEQKAADLKLGCRNDAIVQALTAYVEGEESEEARRARLEEGYCEIHKIAVVGGVLVSIDTERMDRMGLNEVDMHEKTLNFLKSVFLG